MKKLAVAARYQRQLLDFPMLGDMDWNPIASLARVAILQRLWRRLRLCQLEGCRSKDPFHA